MDYVHKQPSTIQGQFHFIFLSWTEYTTIFNRDMKNLDLFCGSCLEVPDCGPEPNSTSPEKFVGGRISSAFDWNQHYSGLAPFIIYVSPED